MEIVFKCASLPKSYVEAYLEVRSDSDVVQFHLITFPDSSRYYNIKVSKSGLNLSLKNHLIYVTLSLTVARWRIWQQLQEKSRFTKIRTVKPIIN